MVKQSAKLNLKWITLWSAVLAAGMVYLFYGLGAESFSYDESYTAAIIGHPLTAIWNIAALDRYPPLYYIMLHVYSLVFGNSDLSLRLFSYAGTILLSLFGIGPVRKIFGNPAGLLYTALVLFLPVNLVMSHEARMYTWSAVFVTGAALYVFLASRDGKKRNWVLFIIFSILAAYTHYYALTAVIVTSVFIFFYLYPRERGKLQAYFISLCIILISYVPWLPAFFSILQNPVSRMHSPHASIGNITDAFIYPFGDIFRSAWPALPAFVAAAGFIASGLIMALKTWKKEDRMAVLASAVYILTIAGGIAASDFIRPLLAGRCVMPVTGLFIIAAAYGIKKTRPRLLQLPGLIVLGLLFIPQHIFIRENLFNGPAREAADYIESCARPGDVFLHTDEETFGLFCRYLKGYGQNLYLGTVYQGYRNFNAFEGPGTIFSNKMAEFAGNHTNFWLVTKSGAAQTRLSESWIAAGKLKINGMAMKFMDRYSALDINLYPVERTLKPVTESEWGIPDLTNSLDRHIYPARSGILKVRLTGFKDDSGTAEVVLYEHGCIEPGNIFRFKKAPVKMNEAAADFEDVPYGEYAVFAFHDRNNNEKPDSIFGIPLEEEGISAGSGKKGYDSAGFMILEDEKDIDIKMGSIY